jgi:hypothetical protein
MWWRDTIERVVATWAEAFLGLLIASWSGALDWSVIETAAWSALPAALAVLKAAAASKRSDTVSPASMM